MSGEPEPVESASVGEPQARIMWWLATRRRRPEWQSLTATGAALFTGRPRAYFERATPGDPVLLYVSKPDHAIMAVGVVVRGAEHSDARESHEPAGGAPTRRDDEEAIATSIEVQLAFELPNPLPWREIAAEVELAQAEPVRQRSSGTLFSLTLDEYAALRSLIEERNPELASAFAALDGGSFPVQPSATTPEHPQEVAAVRESVAPYEARTEEPSLPRVATLSDLQSLTGLPMALLDESRELLEDAGQVVLTGPPGTGKTWLARGLASFVAGDPARVQVVQFHPSTSYEDFIEGLKPRVDERGSVTYAVVPGLFVRLCERAQLDPDCHYVLVIDEINRAPLSQVFGELLYALEYRGPGGAVQLSVSGGNATTARLFYVPENVLIIGTMNSADRSLATLDYALRRRFRFIELEPSALVLDRWLSEHGADLPGRRAMLRLFERANDRLSELLDPDHRLGHSYFMLDPVSGPALDRLWRTAVKPLIAEYFIPPAGEIEEFRSFFSEAAAEIYAAQAQDQPESAEGAADRWAAWAHADSRQSQTPRAGNGQPPQDE